jgi:hypothetical protein
MESTATSYRWYFDRTGSAEGPSISIPGRSNDIVITAMWNDLFGMHLHVDFPEDCMTPGTAIEVGAALSELAALHTGWPRR